MRYGRKRSTDGAEGWFTLGLRLACLAAIGGLASACTDDVPGGEGEVEAPEGSANRSSPADQASASGDSCPPPRDWGVAPRSDEASAADLVRNEMLIEADGSIRWNGAEIDDETARQYLELVSQMYPPPQLDLEVDADAPCDTVSAIVSTASGLLDCDRDCSYRERSRQAP